MWLSVVLTFCIQAALVPLGALSCTTVGVTPGAATNGYTIASQSNDGGSVSDTRLFHVPAQDHPPGSMRAVYAWTGGSFPRYVGDSRGVNNYNTPGVPPTKPIGYIPQVNHTYAYYDAAFGLLNEHGVGMAESTCTARTTGALPRPQGKALWYTDELGRVALERCTTARDAVLLMGKLAVEGGFYGEDNVEGTGESFIVVDKKEVWVFHVLSSDSEGSSAVWVAQRVPDGHVTVVPNIFVVRNIDLDDSDNYLASSNIFDIARKNGWWDGKVDFDFTKVYSAGEYNHRYYSGRRWWGAVHLMAPHLNFPTNYTNLRDDAPYPFSVPLASKSGPTTKKLGVSDVAQVMRSFYEGTEFDLTVGLASGAFGDPNRYDGEIEKPGQPGVKGAWERSIAIYRTDYSHILEIDPELPASTGARMWFAPVGAHTSCYVPFFAGQESLLASYGVGHKGGLVDREKSAMWAFRYVQQITTIRYSRMINDVNELQTAMFKRARDMQKKAQSMPTNASALADLANGHAALVVKSWWALADHLVYKYADGNIYSDPSDTSAGKSTPAGYPRWWLEAVGYPDGPPPPVSGLHLTDRN